MKRIISVSAAFLAAAFLLNTSCSSGDALNRKRAARLLKDHVDKEAIAVLFEGASYEVIVEGTPGAINFINAGFAQLEEMSDDSGLFSAVCLSLTEEGKKLSKQWKPEKGEDITKECPYDNSWTVPVGSLKELDVTGIRTLSDTTALVDFDLEYDLTRTGKAFKEAGVDNPLPFAEEGSNLEEDKFQRMALMELYDDGWRVMEVEKKEQK